LCAHLSAGLCVFEFFNQVTGLFAPENRLAVPPYDTSSHSVKKKLGNQMFFC
jgi:hypothetical protein